uniref:Transposase n=1 Tax=Heterorhabditis bacteriophora TaxID=37862 RepID=A0A1I7XSU5_HETBA
MKSVFTQDDEVNQQTNADSYRWIVASSEFSTDYLDSKTCEDKHKYNKENSYLNLGNIEDKNA